MYLVKVNVFTYYSELNLYLSNRVSTIFYKLFLKSLYFLCILHLYSYIMTHVENKVNTIFKVAT